MKRKKRTPSFSGDTLIEVVLAIAIFSALSVVSMSVMSSGVNDARQAVSLTKASAEMTTQANIIRYIANSSISRTDTEASGGDYSLLFEALLAKAGESQRSEIIPENASSCEEIYQQAVENNLQYGDAFIINPRFVLPQDKETFADDLYKNNIIPKIIVDSSKLKPATYAPKISYSRLSIAQTDFVDYLPSDQNSASRMTEQNTVNGENVYYRDIDTAEGIWIVAKQGVDSSRINNAESAAAKFYDFYISTCWQLPSRNTFNNLTSTVRVYVK